MVIPAGAPLSLGIWKAIIKGGYEYSERQGNADFYPTKQIKKISESCCILSGDNDGPCGNRQCSFAGLVRWSILFLK